MTVCLQPVHRERTRPFSAFHNFCSLFLSPIPKRPARYSKRAANGRAGSSTSFTYTLRVMREAQGGLFRRLAVACHAVPIDGQIGGLKIAVAKLRCFGITFLNCFISRHRLRRVGFRSRVRFRSLSFLRKGWRSGGNNNSGHYQKYEGFHEGLHSWSWHLTPNLIM